MQYGREYKLTIGGSGESIVIEKLRIAFDIEKTISSDPNPATFEIYNLSASNRNLISSGEYDRIQFDGGYEDGILTMFIGWINDVENRIDGDDKITVVTCSDGQKDYRESRTATTVAKGSTDKQIVAEVLKGMPNTGEGVQEIPTIKQLPRGKTLVGNSRDILSIIAKNQNADWSIQDGELLILPKDKALANDEGFLISRDTGMIGSPRKTSDGLEVECYLNNLMKIGQLCRIESLVSEFSGDYKITKLNMRGDFMSNDWKSILQVQGGEFTPVAK